MKAKRKLLFVTGTRADFGKLKSLMNAVQNDSSFELFIFVTGMHMLRRYGSTYKEVERGEFGQIYKFKNQGLGDRMDVILANTIKGLSKYVDSIQPDLLVYHGDRVEALAAASVGVLNNIRTAHLEGGEVSGTVDEMLRHAVSKLSQVHFVANETSKKRLEQLGESSSRIYIIGSPDIDVMISKCLPSLVDVKQKYQICFREFAIAILHPVTTEVSRTEAQVRTFVDSLIASEKNYVVIYPNNDHGSEVIITEYLSRLSSKKFRVFPSVNFECFLTLLKSCEFMIGNSSAGVREAPHYGIPTINIGSRQEGRGSAPSIVDVDFNIDALLTTINRIGEFSGIRQSVFGSGNSSKKFISVINKKTFWDIKIQKQFKDRNFDSSRNSV